MNSFYDNLTYVPWLWVKGEHRTLSCFPFLADCMVTVRSLDSREGKDYYRVRLGIR